jgi:hypothetical protein
LINKSLKRLDYKKILSLNTRLLLTLQNKLTLLFNENSLAQNKREILINLILVFQNELTLSFDKKSLTQSEQEVSSNLILVSQLVEVFTSGAKILRP